MGMLQIKVEYCTKDPLSSLRKRLKSLANFVHMIRGCRKSGGVFEEDIYQKGKGGRVQYIIWESHKQGNINCSPSGVLLSILHVPRTRTLMSSSNAVFNQTGQSNRVSC